MRKLILTLALIAAVGLPAAAQEIEFGAPSRPLQNDATTGTTLNGTAKVIPGTNAAITAGTGDTTVVTLICVNGCGVGGPVGLAQNGQAACTMDTNQSSAGGFFVVNSTTTAGRCHAQAAAPANGTWVIGFLSTTSTTTGATANVWVNGLFYGSSTGGGGGTPCTIAALSLQFNNAGAFGCANNTVVLNAGANQIPSVPAAGTTYLLFDTSANYTQSAAVALSAGGTQFLCGPKVVIQFTGATDGFDISSDKNFLQCILDHNSQSAAGTGPLINITAGNDNVVRGYIQNAGNTNPASSTILMSGTGLRNDVSYVRFLGTQTDSCIGVVPTGSNIITDPLIRFNVVNLFNPGTATLHCLYNFTSSGTQAIVNEQETDNEIHGQGSNADLIYSSLTAITDPGISPGGNFSRNHTFATGTLNEHIHLFGLHKAHVDDFTMTDAGFTVSFGLHGGDWYDTSSLGWVIDSSGTSAPFSVTDIDRSIIKGTMKGVGNGTCGVLLATASAPSTDNQVDVDVTLGANATGFCITANDATGPASHNTITGHVAGTNAANQFVAKVTDTLGGTVGTVFQGITAYNLTNGYVNGAGAVGTQFIDPSFDTVGNRFSDSGTGTILRNLIVANVTKTSQVAAITATTLFTPDSNAQFSVSVSVNCDNSSAAATVNPTISWTDPSNQAQTQSLTSAATCTALGSGSFGQLAFPFRAKSGTNIQYSTAIANTPTYDISVVLEQTTVN